MTLSRPVSAGGPPCGIIHHKTATTRPVRKSEARLMAHVLYDHVSASGDSLASANRPPPGIVSLTSPGSANRHPPGSLPQNAVGRGSASDWKVKCQLSSVPKLLAPQLWKAPRLRYQVETALQARQAARSLSKSPSRTMLRSSGRSNTVQEGKRQGSMLRGAKG